MERQINMTLSDKSIKLYVKGFEKVGTDGFLKEDVKESMDFILTLIGQLPETVETVRAYYLIREELGKNLTKHGGQQWK